MDAILHYHTSCSDPDPDKFTPNSKVKTLGLGRTVLLLWLKKLLYISWAVIIACVSAPDLAKYEVIWFRLAHPEGFSDAILTDVRQLLQCFSIFLGCVLDQ